MRLRHKKIFISGVAVTAAGVLCVGALLQTSLSVQASAQMMPGIETIVNETSGEEPFRILELVDNRQEAEIGYYISGQEPHIKLYEYVYETKDADGNTVTNTMRFSTLEEGLRKLPTSRLRREFANNIKIMQNEDGTEAISNDTGIRNIQDISFQAGREGSETTDYPLSYTPYEETYFLNEDNAEGWKRVDFETAEKEIRTDLISGHYEEQPDGTGDYTKEEQVYYPIRNNVETDGTQTEMYRENIQNFFYSEGEEAGAPYHLEFEEVDNTTVNNALDIENGDTGKQEHILPEYDYTQGKYGYFENVYSPLTSQIGAEILPSDGSEPKYTFPGEYPAIPESAVLVHENSEAVSMSDFESGMADAFVEESFGDDTQEVLPPETENNMQPQEPGDPFGDGGFSDGGFSGDGGAAGGEIPVDMEIFNEEIPVSIDGDISGAVDGDINGEILDGGGIDASGTGPETDIYDSPDENAGMDNGLGDGMAEGGEAPAESEPSETQDIPKSEMSNPNVYMAENITEYPYYKYTYIGNLQEVMDRAAASAANDSAAVDSGLTVVRVDGDITLENDQYWIWQEDGEGSVARKELTVVAGRQPVAYNDIQQIPAEIGYNYYYRVKSVYFCCTLSAEGDAAKGEDYRYFSWYYPAYPQNEDIFLAPSGDAASGGFAATHYISPAQYSLTPGVGNYNFVPGNTEGVDTVYEVQVDHLFYRGGYTNHDWLKRYVFHLSPEEDTGEGNSEFDNFNIQADTLTAAEFGQQYFGETGAAVSSYEAPGVYVDMFGDPVAGSVFAGETQVYDDAFSDEAAADGSAFSDASAEDGSAFSGDEGFSDDKAGDGSDIPEEAAFSDNAAAFAAESNESRAASELGEYDLIYINGQLSENSAAGILNTGIPCIFNYDKITADNGIARAFADYIKTEDADRNFVSQRYYFFSNSGFAGTEGQSKSVLVEPGFHTNVNAGADELPEGGVPEGVLGFEEILEYIESENQYRELGNEGGEFGDGQETELLSSEISPARAVEYILNYRYRRTIKAKDKINVLEIQPTAGSGRLKDKEVLSWLGYDMGAVEKISACCYHRGQEPGAITDVDKNTLWHSAYEGGDTNRNHSGNHYIELELKSESNVQGLRYLPRQDTGVNGDITSFTVTLYDKNGETIADHLSGGFTYPNREAKIFNFGRAYDNVKKIRVDITKSVGGFASCAELGIVGGSLLETPDIDITHMTSSEFVGHIDDINTKYDLVYFGDDGTGRNLYVNGDSPESLYAHVGGRAIRSDSYTKLMGLLDVDYAKNSDGSFIRNEDGKKMLWKPSAHKDDGIVGYLRGSGNDITRQQVMELTDFIKSGYPVVIAGGLLAADGNINEDVVDSSSYMYELLQGAVASRRTNVVPEANAGKETLSFLMNLAKPVIEFESLPPEPQRLNDSEYKYNEKAGIGSLTSEDEGLKYVFSLKNDSEISMENAVYDCNLYIDLNFDGNFSSSSNENQQEYIQIVDRETQQVLTRTDGKYQLRLGRAYELTRKIPMDYYKVITWKMEVSNNANSSIRTSEIGFTKRASVHRQKLKVLQIRSSNNWNLGNDKSFRDMLNRVADFDIEVDVKTVKEFTSQYASKLQGTGENILDGYQMLIIGFADVYENIPNTPKEGNGTSDFTVNPDYEGNGAVEAILDFINRGKSVIFAHDTTSFVNRNPNEVSNSLYPNGEVSDKTTWGYSLNTYLRSAVGMDRYGITSPALLSDLSDPNGGQSYTVSDILKRGQGLNMKDAAAQQIEEKVGDMAYRYNSGRGTTYPLTQGFANNVFLAGNKDTNKASKVNEGAITQYPYYIGDTIDIVETHSQYYQLAMEEDSDGDLKNDIVVWYCLAGPKYADALNDVRNNYYFYSKGNIIYTGVGHKPVGGSETQEKQLFVNAIVAAAAVTAVEPDIMFLKSFNPNAEQEEYRYYMTDQESWTEPDSTGNILEDEMEFYLRIRDYNMVGTSLDYKEDTSGSLRLELFIESPDGDVMEVNNNYASVLNLGTMGVNAITRYSDGKTVPVNESGVFVLSGNNTFTFNVGELERFLQANGSYDSSCKIYARVTSSVYLYGVPVERTSWAVLDLKQRQLFELD